MNYGIPYKGSKNKIAKDIISQLPSAEHFYDLFGGGGAMTHCALLSGKYRYVHYNELNPLVLKPLRWLSMVNLKMKQDGFHGKTFIN